MKIRTDFVTNSSSSSFVAELELQLENGEEIRATSAYSVGEDEVISYFPGSYSFPGGSLSGMRGCYVKNPDQVDKNSPDAWLKIEEGTMSLMCHTRGEEAYRAYPDHMLPELGYEWNEILEKARKYKTKKELFAFLRGLETLQEYSNESLRSVAAYILTEEIRDVLIVQSLDKSGNLSLSVETDPVFSLCESNWYPDSSKNLSFITEEEYRERIEALRRKEEERRQRAEEKQRQQEERRQRAEEKQKQQEEARRQRAEEKLKQAEEKERLNLERRAKQEELRRQRAEEKQKEAAEAKAERERLRHEARDRAVILYAPGEEPENIRRRLDTLFGKLDAAYPDKQISSLNRDHSTWGETVKELYRLLGYSDNQSFLEAYGYTVIQNAGGRKVTTDPQAIMKTLHERYPEGGVSNVGVLREENPDIPWKTLSNNAKQYFGKPLAEHLKDEGILGLGANQQATHRQRAEEKQKLAEVRKEQMTEIQRKRAEERERLNRERRAKQEDLRRESAAAALQDDGELTGMERMLAEAIQTLSQSVQTVSIAAVSTYTRFSGTIVMKTIREMKQKGLVGTDEMGGLQLLKPLHETVQGLHVGTDDGPSGESGHHYGHEQTNADVIISSEKPEPTPASESESIWSSIRLSGIQGFRDAVIAALDASERRASDIVDENNPFLLRRHIDDASPIEITGKQFAFSHPGEPEALAAAELERAGGIVAGEEDCDFETPGLVMIVSLDGRPSTKVKTAIAKGVRMVSLKRIWEIIFDRQGQVDARQ